MKDGGGHDREHDVGGGSGGGDQHHVAPWMAQAAVIDRYRFGVAEQERRARQQHHCRQQDGAERIDVLERVEADAPQFPGGIVTEAVRDKGVGGLMKRDGKDHRQYPGRSTIQRDIGKQGRIQVLSERA